MAPEDVIRGLDAIDGRVAALRVYAAAALAATPGAVDLPPHELAKMCFDLARAMLIQEHVYHIDQNEILLKDKDSK